MVIAQQAGEPLALHAVDATIATVVTDRTRTRLTRRWRGMPEAGAVSAGQAEAQGHAGREPGRPSPTRLPRCVHLHQSARVSRNKQPLAFGMSFFATHGMTARELQRIYMIF